MRVGLAGTLVDVRVPVGLLGGVPVLVAPIVPLAFTVAVRLGRTIVPVADWVGVLEGTRVNVGLGVRVLVGTIRVPVMVAVAVRVAVAVPVLVAVGRVPVGVGVAGTV